MSAPEKVTIAGAAGAWGDSSLSTPQLLADGRADYVVYEGLAEITMAILGRARAQDPDQGYARDLIETIGSNLANFRARGMKVITNAGGVNPFAAAAVIGGSEPAARVAVVTGDDLMGNEAVLSSAGLSGDPVSANVYLGARPIAAALASGAEVVVTGRVVDSALVLGPLIHEFGWEPDQLDLLSAGSLAGHLLECGPQATGGLLTDWEDTPSWANPGFPIAEVSPDGSFVLTTPEGSDGIVDKRTVSEQLLYEIGDPARYQLPDVTCDWRMVSLDEVGPNRVAVSGARGWAPPKTLKGCAQIHDGWRATMLLLIAGRRADDKARRAGHDIVERGRMMMRGAGLGDFRETSIEVLGAEATYGSNARVTDAREVVLKIAVHHDSREAVGRFVREIPSLALGGPPGVSGGGSGLPRPTPLIRLECFPVAREAIKPKVELGGHAVPFDDVIGGGEPAPDEAVDVQEHEGPTEMLPLGALAHGRSGDKGADSNIGIRARHPDFFGVLLRELTADRVAAFLAHLRSTRVERFALPGIHAVNFVLTGGLGAGGSASLRFDPQGKALAQQLLDMEIAVPAALGHHPAIRD